MMSFLESIYPTKVEVLKYFTKGNLKGLRVSEYIFFPSWEDAKRWAVNVILNGKTDYILIEMRDTATGEVADI
jgi:hypothetical protein